MSEQTLPKTDVKLWMSPGACSLAPHILLREIGASFSLVELSSNDLNEEFRRLNPKMRVPVLGLGQEIITEVPAIITAISYMAPEKHILGRTGLETVRVYEWFNWLSGSVHGQAFGGLIRPNRFSDDETMFEAIKAKGLATLKEYFAMIESRLSGIHAVGDDFTAIDVYLYVYYRWGAGHGLDMRADYPKYTALCEAQLKRPAVRSAVERENIKPLGFPDEKKWEANL